MDSFSERQTCETRICAPDESCYEEEDGAICIQGEIPEVPPEGGSSAAIFPARLTCRDVRNPMVGRPGSLNNPGEYLTHTKCI